MTECHAFFLHFPLCFTRQSFMIILFNIVMYRLLYTVMAMEHADITLYGKDLEQLDNTFSETIRRIRIEKGLSQQQCADLMNVDRSTIAGWETGRRMPDVDMITRISNALGTDVSYLVNISQAEQDSPIIIMVDDERIILSGGIPVIKKVLPNSYVKGFTKPSEALDFARDNRVSLAFLDIEIGKLSGLNLCSDLLTINPRTNVIFLTAYMEYSFDAWSTGGSGFLLKPLSADAVKQQLSRLRYPLLGGAVTTYD